ncbi:MAG TPA: hypothetical protein VLI54_07220 [Bacillota bacterium]|nr:hypothetical protein [Bacillota bacterium]
MLRTIELPGRVHIDEWEKVLADTPLYAQGPLQELHAANQHQVAVLGNETEAKELASTINQSNDAVTMLGAVLLHASASEAINALATMDETLDVKSEIFAYHHLLKNLTGAAVSDMQTAVRQLDATPTQLVTAAATFDFSGKIFRTLYIPDSFYLFQCKQQRYEPVEYPERLAGTLMLNAARFLLEGHS